MYTISCIRLYLTTHNQYFIKYVETHVYMLYTADTWARSLVSHPKKVSFMYTYTIEHRVYIGFILYQRVGKITM
jgi:hypothetical protein